MSHSKHLIVIAGPTAVGKTALSLGIAEHFKTEIISADSRQIYKEMEIGTAKPNAAELARVPHHLINSHSIEENYDAGSFARDAEAILSKLFESKDVVILVGGSGLYIKALCDGLDEMPETNPSIREELNRLWDEGQKQNLLEELESKDPTYFELVDHSNRQRVIRALEIFRSTGKPYSEYRGQAPAKLDKLYAIHKIGLELDREVLYERINTRMDAMINNGLFKEAERLYPLKHLNALQTVGYSEIFQFMDGHYDKEEAIRLLKRNSRRYAKRQMTWFKKDIEFKWFSPNSPNTILDFLNSKI